MKKGIILFAIFFSLALVLSLPALSHAGGVDDVLSRAKKGGKPVMLEIGSLGCIPCEQMKAVMEKLRANYKGKLEVVFVDIAKDPDTARRFGVFAIPTQVFLDRNGKEFHRHMGFYAYGEIVPVLKEAGL